jgi:hypothetical protein
MMIMSRIKIWSQQCYCIENGLGYCSRYSDWLNGRSLSHSRIKNFLYSKSSRPALGSTQLLTQRIAGPLSLGIIRPGREAGHLPPASAEVKKTCIYTSNHPYAFKAGTTLLFTALIIFFDIGRHDNSDSSVPSTAGICVLPNNMSVNRRN